MVQQLLFGDAHELSVADRMPVRQQASVSADERREYSLRLVGAPGLDHDLGSLWMRLPAMHGWLGAPFGSQAANADVSVLAETQ